MDSACEVTDGGGGYLPPGRPAVGSPEDVCEPKEDGDEKRETGLARLIEAVPDWPAVEAPFVRLAALEPGPIHWIAAFPGEEAGLAARFPAPGWPEPNRSRAEGDVRAIWAGIGQALWLGPGPEVESAAVVDQTDGWAALSFEGPAHREVLARLCPVDLRDTVFPVDGTARTLLGHVPVSLTRTGAAAWLVLAPRSMARTVWDDLEAAIGRRAARG